MKIVSNDIQITPQIFTVRKKTESTIGGGDTQLMEGGIVPVLMSQGQKWLNNYGKKQI